MLDTTHRSLQHIQKHALQLGNKNVLFTHGSCKNTLEFRGKCCKGGIYTYSLKGGK